LQEMEMKDTMEMEYLQQVLHSITQQMFSNTNMKFTWWTIVKLERLTEMASFQPWQKFPTILMQYLFTMMKCTLHSVIRCVKFNAMKFAMEQAKHYKWTQ